MLRVAHAKRKKEIPKAAPIEALFEDFLRLDSTMRVHKRVKYAKHSDLALESRLYKVFLEMHSLLENYAPLWYSETLHRRAEAIIRECSPHASQIGTRQTSRSSRVPPTRVH
jgi:hypothetical protein